MKEKPPWVICVNQFIINQCHFAPDPKHFPKNNNLLGLCFLFSWKIVSNSQQSFVMLKKGLELVVA